MDKYGLEAPSLEGTQWGLQKSGLCDDDTEVLCALWMKGGKLLQVTLTLRISLSLPLPLPLTLTLPISLTQPQPYP